MYSLTDDIVALATLPGRSALNIVRLSGSSVLSLYMKITRRKTVPSPNLAVPCNIYHNQPDPFDFAVLTFFKGPKSYTGEDLLEVSTHGGIVVANLLIETLIQMGARQALPGEFSYRALVNNKIDLLQAEATSAMVDAGNNLESYYQLNSVRGAFSKAVLKIKNKLVEILTIAEHELDFSDDEITKTKKNNFVSDLKGISIEIQEIIQKSLFIEKQKAAVKVSIVGKPNAGKSSLFNKIIGRSKSIISNRPGTTRDSIETDLYIGNNLITLVDTAGIRRRPGKIEALGIEKTKEEIGHSAVLILIDDKDPRSLYKEINKGWKSKRVIFVLNKIDKNKTINKTKDIYNISCLNNVGLDGLLTHLSTVLNNSIQDIYNQYLFTINTRQKKLLENIYIKVNLALEALGDTEDLTIAISYLHTACDYYADLTGTTNNDDILNNIFGGFCVGK